MKLGKRLGRIGFVVGFVGPFLFYASPFSWFSFESIFVCPWCPYIDVLDIGNRIPALMRANWLAWVNLGIAVGLVDGLLFGLAGFSVGCFVTLVRGKKTARADSN